MEEAYSELYQQFLSLRSLCLRQAALLHQLTTALQKQQGATVPNGELIDMMSIPVQCTQEIPLYLHKRPRQLPAKLCNPAAQCGADCLSRNVGTFSDGLTEDMSKLCVDVPRQRKEDGTLEQMIAPLLSFDFTKWQGASSNVANNPEQAVHRSGDRTMHTVVMPTTEGPSLLMSDVVLQSHVCEFCEAVFPEDTTTRGEFLRHLCTHVT
ncbi:uncharacterized protein LOC115008167 [Cottoperca gobio]|uniref:Uncharacterized protein LOC115008167 n=1 Tax=Cottoperca gobio TaxID=56716 RepID=A0A6J2PPD2_COTGO|nr:uncharacterized protein LOC115008167 [Cottoperca gobio]XP_029287400.1 uncharacterized protein LOC115008167 [Cottoperca gobio]XP_029287401.1 uncharacterized protein LOC115008167 [Cottoperca gobio]XP_029287402.1 uncharacterized protein LOC115008167 [Cottoperca gobio]XP_029287403.1 uncharacterized protein LOC115008167 [Cottoperca gobio]XP_029287404.1 uncharacterized protein LOC115008167 [Cottoperca gobio]XP_029287405.1 uncharacterized protein LOC115008167 [Cottoperca gobio]XP_029287407.1 unc